MVHPNTDPRRFPEPPDFALTDTGGEPPPRDAVEILADVREVRTEFNELQRRDRHRDLGLIDWTRLFTEDRPDADWLIEPIAPRNRITAVYARAGQGKSEMVLERVARAVVEQGLSVVYLDFEMTEDDVLDRLTEMGYGPEDLEGLAYYLLPSIPPMDTPEGGAAVREIADYHDADLVVVDTVSRTLSGNENDSQTLTEWDHHTGQPLKRDGRAVLRLDHEGKDASKGQRGTSAKGDDADLVWRLTQRDGGTRLELKKRRSSWIPETVDLARIEGPPLRYEIAADTYPPGTEALADVLDRLDVPTDYGRRKVDKALTEAGEPTPRPATVVAAQRYRRDRDKTPPDGPGTGAEPPRNHPPTTTRGTTRGTTPPKTGSDQGRNHPRNHAEPPPRGDSGSVPLPIGEPPTPDPGFFDDDRYWQTVIAREKSETDIGDPPPPEADECVDCEEAA